MNVIEDRPADDQNDDYRRGNGIQKQLGRSLFDFFDGFLRYLTWLDLGFLGLGLLECHRLNRGLLLSLRRRRRRWNVLLFERRQLVDLGKTPSSSRARRG